MAAYNSPYYAEVYDLDMEQMTEQNQEIGIYFDAFKELRSLRPQCASHEYLVLDVGTGTGRVLKQFAENMKRENISPDYMRFVGLDLSPDMIRRAKKSVPKYLASSITYTVGSALDLQAGEGLNAPQTVDLLIFAYNSISLLVEPGAAEQFLRETVKILRPGTGRAYIPVGFFFDDGKEKERKQLMQTYSKLPARVDTASKTYPNLFYRFPDNYWSTRREGQISISESPLQVIEKGTDGHERVIADENTTTRGRIWREGEFFQAALAAGLDLVETKQTSSETIYVLSVPL